AGDGDDGILFRHHDAELAESAIAAVSAMPATPELTAVTLIPIARRVAAIGSLPRRGGFHPRSGHQLSSIPLAFLQIKLPEPRDVLRPDVQSQTAKRDALRAGFPRRIFNAERFEKPWPEIIEHGHPRHLLHDGRQHVAAGGVVNEQRRSEERR